MSESKVLEGGLDVVPELAADAPAADEALTEEPVAQPVAESAAELTAESLIEDVSIDGMCGVY